MEVFAADSNAMWGCRWYSLPCGCAFGFLLIAGDAIARLAGIRAGI
jgi:hypothetical protein